MCRPFVDRHLAGAAMSGALLAGLLLVGGSFAISPAAAQTAGSAETAGPAQSAAPAQPSSTPTAASAPVTSSGPRLAQRLRAGGFVLVMRHASAPRARPDASAAESDNPNHERQLDPAGKASARELGAALRALRIPIGPIYSSPTYRALETIRLAGLGMPQVVPQLAEGAAGMAGTADAAQIEWLRHAVAQPPPPGRNTLIVTHTPDIVGAFGRAVADIRAGEMLIFEPEPRGRARLLGRITIAEWQRLARAQAR